jgi:folate-dependent phosphoribosylglycinamide formyltransferase PurN
MRTWIAFFSQSGKEIADISKVLQRQPDFVITNNMDQDSYHPDMKEVLKGSALLMGKHDRLMDVMRNTGSGSIVKWNALVTLHGYLRILPGDVCEAHDIYNGHPGLITRYPDLKGKDPQEKVIKNPEVYSHIGSVVHKCTAELDGGKVVEVSESELLKSGDDMFFDGYVYNTLRMHSLQAWTNFLKRKLV